MAAILSLQGNVLRFISLRLSDVLYASLNCAIIGADNDLSPVHHQAIIWTHAGLLLIGHSLIQISMKFEQKYNNFPAIKFIWKYHLRNGIYFVSASMR